MEGDGSFFFRPLPFCQIAEKKVGSKRTPLSETNGSGIRGIFSFPQCSSPPISNFPMVPSDRKVFLLLGQRDGISRTDKLPLFNPTIVFVLDVIRKNLFLSPF